jgi:soluble cytochrome b562
MNKSLRTLKRQISDAAKKDDNLALLGKMKGNLAEAIKLEPKKTKDVPAAEKAAYVEKFKQELTELGKTYDQLEAAIKDGKTAEAKAIFDKISEQKEKGHKDFGVDEE